MLFQLSEEERDERVLAERDFVLYLNMLAVMDRLWINESIRKQEKALQKLKVLHVLTLFVHLKKLNSLF